MKKKFISISLFLSIFIILELVLMPVIVNYMNLLYGLKDLYVVGIPIFNVKLLFSSDVAIRWSIAITSLIIVLMAYLKSKTSSNKSNKGSEHGSARLLKDDEFESLLKASTFRKDEYAHQRLWDHVIIEDLSKKYAIEVCEMKETVDENSNIEANIEDEMIINNETGEVLSSTYIKMNGGEENGG